MGGPAISAIIPAYNSAAFVGNAIRSALEQTLMPAEILVVDDGSTDNTAEVVSAFPAPVHLIRKSNGGPSAARNAAAAEARGEWLAFLDADDGWTPDKLERQAALCNDARVGIVHTRVEGVSFSSVPDEVDFARLWEANCVGTSSVMIRRRTFEEVGGFPLDMSAAEDYYLWMRVAAAGWRILTCQERLTRYTPAPTSVTRRHETFARAEVQCLGRIGREMRLGDQAIRRRMLASYVFHLQALVHQRNLGAARRLSAEALKVGLSPAVATWWLVARLPMPVLDFKRRLGA